MASKKDMIKVRFVLKNEMTETLWAYLIGDKYAQLANIPFFCGYGIDDIVEVDDSSFRVYATHNKVRDFVKLIKRNTNTFFGEYQISRTGTTDDNEEDEKKFNLLKFYFAKYGLRIEGSGLGRFALAAHIDFDESRIIEIARESPVTVTMWEE